MIKNYRGTTLNIIYSLIYVAAAFLLISIKASELYENQSDFIIITYIVSCILIALGFAKSYLTTLKFSDNKIELLGMITKKEIVIDSIENVESDKTKNEVIVVTKENKKFQINLGDINGKQRKEFEDRILSLNI
ncbi:MAG: hypothetical protein E6X34_08240 [Clostridium sp.]|uniref:hypothetical protein n=1 Tax=Clostridium sp. TaxID=1506 RepID=UPI0029111629|nr:hypothetical protein [Clostridium sp.]MDU4938435.1 hypothetical protein [Clostridium sp.]